MQLQWSEAQKALSAQYAAIGRSASTDELASGKTRFDQATWDLLTDAGLWQIIIPTDYGGTGSNWWDFTAALEGLAKGLRSPGLLLSVIAQAGMVRALTLYGTVEQKRTYFRKILNGALSATAIADPDTGTDVRATSTILTPAASETFRLDGRKYNIAHAPVADFVLVVCKLSGKERSGISLVIVDYDNTPGLRIGAKNSKFGNFDLPTGQLEFDNVALDYGHLLGVPGEGLRNLINIVSLGRLYYGLIGAWLLAPMLDKALHYAQSRTTFDVPIADHQYIQKKLTDMRIGIENTKWVSYAALDQLLSGDRNAALMCSVSKITGADTIVDGALDLVKLYGSKGYHTGEVTTFLRDALAFCSVGGTEEMHRRNIFSQMMRQYKTAATAPQKSKDETVTIS